jgi:hypothetical protein
MARAPVAQWIEQRFPKALVARSTRAGGAVWGGSGGTIGVAGCVGVSDREHDLDPEHDPEHDLDLEHDGCDHVQVDRAAVRVRRNRRPQADQGNDSARFARPSPDEDATNPDEGDTPASPVNANRNAAAKDASLRKASGLRRTQKRSLCAHSACED